MTKKVKKLDNETIRKLAGLLPINNEFQIKFTPDCFKNIDDEFKPSFILKPFTSKEVKEIALKMTGKVDNDFIMNQIKKQITGWNNLINIASCEEVEFNDENKETLPIKLMNDISAELLRISGLSS